MRKERRLPQSRQFPAAWNRSIERQEKAPPNRGQVVMGRKKGFRNKGNLERGKSRQHRDAKAFGFATLANHLTPSPPSLLSTSRKCVGREGFFFSGGGPSGARPSCRSALARIT